MSHFLFHFTALIATALFTAGCGTHNCRNVITQNARVLSWTATAPTLTFCKGGAKPGVVDVDQSKISTDFVVYLSNADEFYDKPYGDCATHYGDVKFVPVALTTASFSLAKLCYASSDKSSVKILKPTETCPAGTTEQAQPVDDCSSL